MVLTSWSYTGWIFLSFLIIAALLRAYTHDSSARIKRVGFFCVTFVISVSISHFVLYFNGSQTHIVTTNIANLLGWLTLVELFTIVAFRLFLPRLGYSPPSIVSELFLGGSIIVLIIYTLRNFGVDATGIAATSAIVTGILAIGLQATLGNVIGGIALQLDRSIRVGDWVQLENGQQGKVQQIRWRHTVLETRDWDSVVVPNSSLLAANIIILGKREGESTQHRMWVRFAVDYRTNPSFVIETVERALRATPSIPLVAHYPQPNCICIDFASEHRESYALYAVRYWLTNIQDDDPTNSLIRCRVYAALKRANIPLAIPAAQLIINNDNNKRREHKAKIEHQKRLEVLREIEFLQVLNEEELNHVAKSLHPVLYAKNESIIIQHDISHWFYIMTEGIAEVSISDGDNHKKVAELKAPTFFGEMGLMTGEPRSATIIATSDVFCYRLHRNGFIDILQNRPDVAEKISTILAARASETQSIREMLNNESHLKNIEKASVDMLTKISHFFGL